MSPLSQAQKRGAKMSNNKDGYEPGQILTFAQVQELRSRKSDVVEINDPDNIDKMKKTDVRELLEAHGVEIGDSATVFEMRKALKRVVYI